MRKILLGGVSVMMLTSASLALAQVSPLPEKSTPPESSVALPAAPEPSSPEVAPESSPPQTPVPDSPSATADATPAEEISSAAENTLNEQIAFRKPNVNINTMLSLFFTAGEHDLILDARRGLTTRSPETDDGVPEEQTMAPTGPRDISLGGIVYHGKKDWTIWLNSMRVSPEALPDKVMDLKVYKDYIELEWFDSQTNQIYPIRLRPHQRFNLDTRMFLPG